VMGSLRYRFGMKGPQGRKFGSCLNSFCMVNDRIIDDPVLIKLLKKAQ
jgi:hypothetical protein